MNVALRTQCITNFQSSLGANIQVQDLDKKRDNYANYVQSVSSQLLADCRICSVRLVSKRWQSVEKVAPVKSEASVTARGAAELGRLEPTIAWLASRNSHPELHLGLRGSAVQAFLPWTGQQLTGLLSLTLSEYQLKIEFRRTWELPVAARWTFLGMLPNLMVSTTFCQQYFEAIHRQLKDFREFSIQAGMDTKLFQVKSAGHSSASLPQFATSNLVYVRAEIFNAWTAR